MEKRLILAMFLIFVTTMVWYWTMLPTSVERPPLEEQTPETVTQEEPKPAQLKDTEKEIPQELVENVIAETEVDTTASGVGDTAFDTTSDSRLILINTDTFRAQIDTRGAALVNWELKKFRGYIDGDRVQQLPLIPEKNNNRNLTFQLEVDGETVDFADVIFQTELDSLVISEGSEADTLDLITARGEQVVHVKYIFYENEYRFDYDITARNIDLAEKNIQFRWGSGLNFTEKSEKTDQQYLAGLVDQEGEILSFDHKKINKNDGLINEESYRWVGLKTHYFAFIASPLNTELNRVTFQSLEASPNIISATWQMPAETLDYIRHDFRIYFGPQDYNILQQYHRNWERIVDFGWDWIEPLSRFMLLIFTYLYQVFPNYGLVIVIFSALTKIVFYPLMQKQLKSMKAMQAVQPEMTELKEKFKDDPQKLNQEMIKLYQKHKINPLSGCLPILVQMPIFIALYNVLRTTIHLRDANFLWIADLSQNPDLSPIGVLLPLGMGGSMYLTQKMSSASADPRQKMLLYMMPVILTVFSFQWSTGLILYWFVNNILTMAQQFFINRAKDDETESD